MEEIDSLRIDFQKAIESKNGSFIYHTKSKFALKETGMAEWEILAISSIMDHIKSNGFKNLVTLKKDTLGKPYYREDNRTYLIFDRLEGSKFKLSSQEDGMRFSEFIAEFHACSQGYVQPSGIKAFVLWGRRMEEYRAMTQRIEKNYKNLKIKKNENELEAFVLEHGDEIIKRARESMKILKSTAYLKALEKSMRKKEICLNNISNKTAVVYNNEIVLKKVFDMGYNMAIEDIALIVKKIIEQTYNLNSYDYIIDSYKNVREIEQDSSLIIKAIAAFPEDTAKTIDRYFKNPIFDQAILAKLKNYWFKESKVNLLGV